MSILFYHCYTTLDTLRNGGMESLVLGKSRAINFQIPSGSRVGQKLRLKGAAKYINKHLEGGDINLLVFAVNERVRHVRDVQIELPLAAKTLSNGSVERLSLGEKKIDLKIPSGLHVGQTLRLGGLARHINGGYAGDIHLRLIQQHSTARIVTGALSNISRPKKHIIGITFNLSLYHLNTNVNGPSRVQKLKFFSRSEHEFTVVVCQS